MLLRQERDDLRLLHPGFNPTQLENMLPGTTEWQLDDPAMNQELEGYASATSVNRGGVIRFYVSALVDELYGFRMFRMGWYNGTGAREVITPFSLRGIKQQYHILRPDERWMAECDWVEPFEFRVPRAFASGFYLVQLTGVQSGKQSFIIFVVRDDERKSDLMMSSAVTTYHAYNNWGGRSTYSYNSEVASCCADRVSFNRPYGANALLNPDFGVGAGEFISSYRMGWSCGWEYNMVRFLEREGYDVKYCTNIDSHSTPDVFYNSKAFVSVGHDEYWSREMYDNIARAKSNGVSIAFFGANICYYSIDLEPDAKNVSSRVMVAAWQSKEKKWTKDLWRAGRYQQPEGMLIGVQYICEANGDLTVLNPTHWVYNQTGLRAGDRLRTMVGYEADALADGTAPCVEHLAHSKVATHARPWQASSDTVVYRDASRAIVFAAGTIQWSWGVDDFIAHPGARPLVSDPAVQQMTRNVLNRMIAPRPPGPYPVIDDSFDGSDLDDERWCRSALMDGVLIYNRNATVTVRDGTLRLELEPGKPGRQTVGVVSRGMVDLTRGQMPSIRVVKAPGRGPTLSFGLAISNKYFTRITVDSRIGFSCTSNSPSVPNFGEWIWFDPAKHSSLRYRYDAAANRLHFDGSGEPAAGAERVWASLASFQPWLPLNASYIELSVTTWGPEKEAQPDAHVTILDDFRVLA